MRVEYRHGLDELRGLARAEREASMRIRIQAVVLAKQCRTAEEIAATLGVSRTKRCKVVGKGEDFSPWNAALLFIFFRSEGERTSDSHLDTLED